MTQLPREGAQTEDCCFVSLPLGGGGFCKANDGGGKTNTQDKIYRRIRRAG